MKPFKNSIRIIGGDLRSRKIEFPTITGLRPTSDRVRETLFNWIQMDLAGNNCLDLFSGSGALGIESLSRGASSVTFVEENQIAAKSIQENLNRLHLSEGQVVCSDALKWIDNQKSSMTKYDVVFLDPPFSSNIMASTCQHLDSNGLLNKACKIYTETSIDPNKIIFPQSWRRLKEKKAGQVFFSLFINDLDI
ncbi:MAG: 16S rRNA (guanine966-N2)-methyltransferase [Pseudohongiellaceae bacterium]|jgi:16S rRNA (guanine966-N2)-methyltransferase